MNFNGAVGDLGSKEFQGVVYDKKYVGKGTKESLENYIASDVKTRGHELVDMKIDEKKDGNLEANCRIRSMNGI